MDFQAFVDSFSQAAVVISVEKKEEGKLLYVVGNKAECKTTDSDKEKSDKDKKKRKLIRFLLTYMVYKRNCQLMLKMMTYPLVRQMYNVK